MKLLADENIEGAMLEWLRKRGQDVESVSLTHSGVPDPRVLEIANGSSRILLTRDLDFGELVFRERLVSTGIISLRIRARNQWDRLSVFAELWSEIETRAVGSFITVMNDRLRIRRLPPK